MLKRGELVAFPTETVYGLGANALDESAVAKIFNAKGRPGDNPLIVHVASFHAVAALVEEIDQISAKLAHAFWPGPLTIIFPLAKDAGIARNVSAGLCTVGIRVPDHPVALALLTACQLPLAAPSSNKSGSPSPTTAEHVQTDLRDSAERPEMILNGGSCRVGLESTVVQVRGDVVHILRPGGITKQQLEAVVSPAVVVESFQLATDGAPRAPGMKYRHYAPKATVVVVTDWSSVSLEDDDVLLLFESTLVSSSHQRRLWLGVTGKDVESASNRIFDLFRQADEMKATRILVDCSFDRNAGLGTALWNRISKAASANS